jgi:hypothetical protein
MDWEGTGKDIDLVLEERHVHILPYTIPILVQDLRSALAFDYRRMMGLHSLEPWGE